MRASCVTRSHLASIMKFATIPVFPLFSFAQMFSVWLGFRCMDVTCTRATCLFSSLCNPRNEMIVPCRICYFTLQGPRKGIFYK